MQGPLKYSYGKGYFEQQSNFVIRTPDSKTYSLISKTDMNKEEQDYRMSLIFNKGRELLTKFDFLSKNTNSLYELKTNVDIPNQISQSWNLSKTKRVLRSNFDISFDFYSPKKIESTLLIFICKHRNTPPRNLHDTDKKNFSFMAVKFSGPMC